MGKRLYTAQASRALTRVSKFLTSPPMPAGYKAVTLRVTDRKHRASGYIARVTNGDSSVVTICVKGLKLQNVLVF